MTPQSPFRKRSKEKNTLHRSEVSHRRSQHFLHLTPSKNTQKAPQNREFSRVSTSPPDPQRPSVPDPSGRLVAKMVSSPLLRCFNARSVSTPPSLETRFGLGHRRTVRVAQCGGETGEGVGWGSRFCDPPLFAPEFGRKIWSTRIEFRNPWRVTMSGLLDSRNIEEAEPPEPLMRQTDSPFWLEALTMKGCS